MKNLFILLLAGIVLPGFSGVYAATGATPAATIESVQIQQKKAYKPTRTEFANYAHTYSLATGQYLSLERVGGRFFAELTGEPQVEIFPVEPGVFVTPAGTRLSFRNDGDTVVIVATERLHLG